MSDAAVKAKTGKDWAGWFAVLDRAGAASFDHKGIVALLSDTHDVPAWWRQISKLTGKAEVEAQRESWKSALGKLQKLQELLEP